MRLKKVLPLVVCVIALSGACGGSEGDGLRAAGPVSAVPSDGSFAPETCIRGMEGSERTGGDSPGTVPPTPTVDEQTIQAALSAIRSHPDGRKALDSPGAKFKFALPWTNLDGHELGVIIDYEFRTPTDLPNLGIEKYDENGSEEGILVTDDIGRPVRQPVESSELLNGVLSGSFWVQLPEGQLYLAAGSSEHFYCY